MRRTATIVAVGLLVCASVVGCSVDDAVTGAGKRVDANTVTIDAEELADQMWGLLSEEGRLDMCDMYDMAGDDAGVLFLAGLESNPVADQLTDVDQDAIKAAGLAIMRQQC